MVQLAACACGGSVLVTHQRDGAGTWTSSGWTRDGMLWAPLAVEPAFAGETPEELERSLREQPARLTDGSEWAALAGGQGMAGGGVLGIGVGGTRPVLLRIGCPREVTLHQLDAARTLLVRSQAHGPLAIRLLRELPVALLAVTPEGQILYASPFLHSLNRDPDGLVGGSILDLMPEGEWERLRRELTEGDQSVVDFRSGLMDGDGEWVAMSFAACQVRDAQGASMGLALAARDRRGERQFEQYRRLESVDRMVSGVAHELNNPLLTVVGNAEMLAGMKLPEAAVRRAQRVLGGAQRCREVVDGLLKLKRRRHGGYDRVVPEDLMRNVSQRLTAEVEGAAAWLKLEMVDPVPTVEGRPEEVEQAVENVVRNALQAVAAQPQGGEVRVRVEGDDEQLHLQVTDTGGGMPAEVEDRVFEPFFTTRGVGAGKGLGLSIALGIVKEHGGLIDVVGLPGGTRVSITLPVRRGTVDEAP